MVAIFKREIKSFFVTPIFYIFLTMFLFLSAFFFQISGIMRHGVADISLFFELMPWTLMFLIPVLTMRSIADERKSKTDQLLLTAPVKMWEIVLAKYFAALCVFVIAILSTLIFPAILFFLGNPGVATVISHYLGYILYGAALIAIGIFISSLTENQFIAAVVTFGLLFMLTFISMLGVWSGDIRIARAVNFVSLQNRFEYFNFGILDLSSIIYFILIAALFIFLTVQRLDRKRVV